MAPSPMSTMAGLGAIPSVGETMEKCTCPPHFLLGLEKAIATLGQHSAEQFPRQQRLTEQQRKQMTRREPVPKIEPLSKIPTERLPSWAIPLCKTEFDAKAAQARRREEPTVPVCRFADAMVTNTAACVDATDVTTLIVRNVDWVYSQGELIEEWKLAGTFDFLHAPYSPYLGHSSGFVVVNFTRPEYARRFTERWHGSRMAKQNFKKKLSIVPARIQGRNANLQTVREDTVVLPAVFLGGRQASPETVLTLISLAKAGTFAFSI
uniref:Mei2-like C-terminal RNA recognition motif domain-containing protein n=1 Tax=Alexandrium monilatum TaxID=311494 RepID=A0A7S4PYM7_9DINO